MSDDSTKDKIILAAGPIFASKGFRAATVREICDSAGVNVASINYYFGDKQRLYNDTVMRAREMRAQEHPFPDWDASTEPEVKLHGFITLVLNRLVAMDSEPWQVRLLMREILNPTEACRHLVQEYFRPVFEQLLMIVDELVGERLPTYRRNQIGFSIVGQCLHYRYSYDITTLFMGQEEFDNHFDKVSLADHITRFSMGAILAIKESELGQSPKTKVP